MRLIKKLLQHTIFYRVYDFFASAFSYIRDYRYIHDTLYSDELKFVIKKYLNINIKEDWIGRLYGIINPNIDIDGNFNPSNVIIEIDDDNTNNNEYVKSWVYKQLNLVGELFKINNLYDYITVDFRHVGPVNADNFLVIFDISSRKWFIYALKKFLLHTSILGAIAAILLIFVF